MICPECKYQYEDGVLNCPDCETALVEQLPPEPMLELSDYMHLMSTYNTGDVAFIKSLLDAEGLSYYFQGEHFSVLRPLVEPARLLVENKDVEKAEDLLEGLELNYFWLVSAKKWAKWTKIDKENGADRD